MFKDQPECKIFISLIEGDQQLNPIAHCFLYFFELVLSGNSFKVRQNALACLHRKKIVGLMTSLLASKQDYLTSRLFSFFVLVRSRDLTGFPRIVGKLIVFDMKYFGYVFNTPLGLLYKKIADHSGWSLTHS